MAASLKGKIVLDTNVFIDYLRSGLPPSRNRSCDCVFTSPLAARLTGDAVVRGKAGLRDYWRLGLEQHPSLRFELETGAPSRARLIAGRSAELGAR